MANGTVPYLLHANFVGKVSHDNTVDYKSNQQLGVVIEKGSTFPIKPSTGSIVNGRLFYYTPVSESDGDGKGQGLCEFVIAKVNDVEQDFVVGGLETVLNAKGWRRINKEGTSTPSGLKIRPARVKTTSAIDLATTSIGSVIDGITLNDKDIIFVNTQSGVNAYGADLEDPENGLYLVSSGGLHRVSYADEWDDHVGLLIVVNEGTVFSNSLWASTADTGGTIDTDPLYFFSLEIGVTYDCLQLGHDSENKYSPYSAKVLNTFQFVPLWSNSDGVNFFTANDVDGNAIHTQLIVTPENFGIPYMAMNKPATIATNAYKPFSEQDATTFKFAPLEADSDLTFTNHLEADGITVKRTTVNVNFPSIQTQDVFKFTFPAAPVNLTNGVGQIQIAHAFNHNTPDVKFYERVGASSPYSGIFSGDILSPIEIDYNVSKTILTIFTPMAFDGADINKYVCVMEGYKH